MDSTQTNILKFFPYEPYQCQLELMEKTFQFFRNKHVAILESPTGTGKSLILLSAVLAYLDSIKNENKKDIPSKKDHLSKENHTTTHSSSYSFDWLKDFGKQNEQPQVIPLPVKRKHTCFTNRSLTDGNTKKLKSLHKEEDEKMLIQFDDSNDIIHKFKKLISTENNNTQLQVFYCTRTHSQVSQIVSEIKKINEYYKQVNKMPLDFSFASLGSRKLLCINKKINNGINSINCVNNKCMEMLENSKCEFYTEQGIESLAIEMNKKVFDIEDLVNLGKNISSCPYFASRMAMQTSDIVILPYNSIINSKIRNSLGISLQNKIIIFDEAHNIVDNILQANKSEMSLEMLFSLSLGIIFYYEKYSTRLKSSSNLYLRQLLKISESLIQFIIDSNATTTSSMIFNVTEVLIELNLTSINFYKLVEFIEISELEMKVRWTIEKKMREEFFTSEKKANAKIEYDKDSVSSHSQSEYFNLVKTHMPKLVEYSQILNLVDVNINKICHCFIDKDCMNRYTSFLTGLTFGNEDGKIILDQENLCNNAPIQMNVIKYVMVNPCKEFANVIKESKILLFAGGTMKPMDEFFHLLRTLKKEEIEVMEGDHVIPGTSVQVSIMTNDICNSQGKLLFTYENFHKNEKSILCLLLGIVQHYSKILKDNVATLKSGIGIVVFLQNYELLKKLQKLNESTKIIENDLISIFFEKSDQTDTFQQYKRNISDNHINSVLFAVVGGKLSEGINFSDDLARIVLIFGLPFPNIKSPEMKIKMNYYDELHKKGETETHGEDYYENLCMKSVNQCIGRSIRHSKDYAAIVLVDSRYSIPRIMKKLPKWVLKSGVNEVGNKISFERHRCSLLEFLQIHK